MKNNRQGNINEYDSDKPIKTTKKIKHENTGNRNYSGSFNYFNWELFPVSCKWKCKDSRVCIDLGDRGFIRITTVSYYQSHKREKEINQ